MYVAIGGSMIVAIHRVEEQQQKLEAKILELTNLRQQAISAPITTTSQRAIANRAQEIQHLQGQVPLSILLVRLYR